MTARAILLSIARARRLALPTRAQEVVSILNQKEWSVGGVGIGRRILHLRGHRRLACR